MRRTWSWVLIALLVFAGIGIGLGAYNAGYDNGLTAQPAANVQVVRYVGHGFGFFPGFFFIPLLFLLIFAVRAGRHNHWRAHHSWRGDEVDEWHRHQHEQTGIHS
jgi:hypothetical protein